MRFANALVALCGCCLLITSCAHTSRSTVAMKINDSEAHIGLGSQEVRSGDRIALFENKCERPLGGVHQGVHNDPVCSKVKIGEATVTHVMDAQYSVAKVDPGVSFKEGTVVEKR